MTTLDGRLANLSPAEIKSLVGALSRGKPAVKQRAPRNAEQRYPLSAAQQRLWFLARLVPDSRAHNNPAAMRVRPAQPLDRDRLAAAFDAIGRRHEILRTTFHLVDDSPAQIIHDNLPLSLDWEDLRDLPEAEREAAALGIAKEEGRRHFDLETGPLIALKALQLGEHDYLLLATSHHIVSDGWSNALFAQELSTLYSGRALPPLELQYIDYVHWEREWLKSPASHAQRDFWRARIDPQQPPLALPVDRARALPPGDAGGMETLALPADTAERLRRFARQERVSLFPVMMTALVALLHRLTGAGRISIGTIAANRNERDFQKILGPLLNTLVMQFNVACGDTFRTLLRSASAEIQDGLQRQELPFNVLLNELKVRRDYGVHPLFQVMLVHQNVPAQYASPGMDIEVMKIDYGTTKLDLNFWIEEINGGLVVTLYYAKALFEPATIHQLMADYRRVLERALEQPDAPIVDLLVDAPAPPTARPETAESFVARFEKQVARTPDLPAAVGVDGCMTYRQLEAAANWLARRLAAPGATIGQPIGLLTRRTTGMITGLLGILKSGAPFLPLEPSHPPGRLRALLEDAGARLVVIDADTAPLVAAFPLTAVSLADAMEEETEEEACAPHLRAAPDDLAYVIYTSGTSGAPKGVCVEHRQLVAYSEAVWERMELAGAARFATVSPLAADLGNTMIFPALMHGGCVIVAPEDAITDSALLAGFFAKHPVDCLKMTPGHLAAVLDRPELLPRQLLVLGGEACGAALIEQIRSFAPALRILNHYGPTETTIGVLTHEIANPAPDRPPPLGRPLSGVSVEILDEAGRRLPVGAIGEIWIAGATVARGYWRRREATRQCFVVDPQGGERRYRTGDLGKRHADGTISFHGRVDRQIKVRGYRVEPGEIEAKLASHPAVAQAALRLNDAGQLIACVVAKTPVDDATLTRFLRECLPAYMVPAAIMFVDEMPRTPAGKIDLSALPEPRFTARAGTTGPRDEIELALVLIWQDVFDRPSISVHDDFFELGGHSLLAVRLIARIRARFGRDLALASLFEHGSVAALAGLLRVGPLADEGPLVTISRGAGAPRLILLHPAGGDVLCYYSLAQALASAHPVLGLRAQPGRQETSISAIAQRYFDALPPLPAPVFAGWSMGALIAFELARLWDARFGAPPTVAILDQPVNVDDATKDDVGDDDARMLAFARKVSELVDADIGIGRTELDGRSTAERAATFLAAFQRHGLAPEGVAPEHFEGYLQLLLSHNRITAGYRPATPYRGRVVVLRAETPLSIEGVRTERAFDLGWRNWCCGKLEVLPVPGNHVTMMKPPHVATLAKRLADLMGPA